MLVNLASLTTAEVVQKDQFLSHKPRWDVRGISLVLGAYNNGYEHEEHLVMDSVGSTDNFELRFNKNNLVLTSALFRVPETNIDLATSSIPWLEEIPLTGLLHLTDPKYFEPEPPEFRWFDPEGQVLICINEHGLSEQQNRFRLRIAMDVDLMFSDNQLCGWMLSQPLRYVTHEWEDPQPFDSDTELASIAHKYLQLVSEDFFEQMEDEDPKILQALLEVKQKLQNKHSLGYQRKVFGQSIESIVEQYYGELAA
jgi:hypothetical protein